MLWRDLCEKSDRTSPAEHPDMVLVTLDELRAALRVGVEWERDRIRGLMEKSHRALSPFVFESKSYDPPEDDDNLLLWGELHLTIGHLRNARDAYDAILTELGGNAIRSRTNPDDCNPSDYT
jgi:hypothetical protein